MSRSKKREELPEVQFIRRKNQKHLRLRLKSGKVVVSAPRHCSKKVMMQFLKENEDWIQEQLREIRMKRVRIEQKLAKHKGELLLRGQWKPVRISPLKGVNPTAIFRERNEYIDLHSNFNGLSSVPQNLIEKFYRKLAKREIPSLCHKWSEFIPVSFNKIYIRSQRTKWGSCSGKKNLSFNWRLMKCPPLVMNYLVVHELSHLKEFNHSKAFWSLVQEYFPEQQKARKWIDENEDLIFRDLWIR